MLKMLNDYAQGKVIQEHNIRVTLTKKLRKTAVTLFVFNHILQSKKTELQKFQYVRRISMGEFQNFNIWVLVKDCIDLTVCLFCFFLNGRIWKHDSFHGVHLVFYCIQHVIFGIL